MVAAPFFAIAQSSLFDKFEDMNDVSSVIVNKEAFKMLSKFKGSGPEVKEYMDLVQNIESFRVFTTENSAIASQMSVTIDSYLKSSKLTELMRIKDKDANVKIYIRQGKDENHVNELLMFVNDMKNKTNQQAVILSLTGSIDLNKISTLVEPHIPNSGKHLKKQ